MKEWIKYNLAMLMGNWFSLDRKFKRGRATASISFVKDERLGGSIKLHFNGVEYFFEGKPEIEKYKNAYGKNVTRKKIKYGGWGIDLTAEENNIFN